MDLDTALVAWIQLCQIQFGSGLYLMKGYGFGFCGVDLALQDSWIWIWQRRFGCRFGYGFSGADLMAWIWLCQIQLGFV